MPNNHRGNSRGTSRSAPGRGSQGTSRGTPRGTSGDTYSNTASSLRRTQAVSRPSNPNNNNNNNNNSVQGQVNPNTSANSQNVDDDGFKEVGSKQSNPEAKIRNLIINLQNSLKSLNIIDPLTDIYCKMNYLFRFFECMRRVLEKSGVSNREEVYINIYDLRKIFIHQLPFFASIKENLVKKFILKCLDLIEILDTTKGSIKKQLDDMATEIMQLYEYNEIASLRSDELKPVDVVIKIQTTLLILKNVVDAKKDINSAPTIHAITMIISHYWELVNTYHKIQKNYTHPKCKQFDEFFSTKGNNPNKLTEFARPFRDHKFAHVRIEMIDNNGDCRFPFGETQIYYAENLDIMGYKDNYDFNEKLFIELANMAEDYLGVMLNIDPELVEDLEKEQTTEQQESAVTSPPGL